MLFRSGEYSFIGAGSVVTRSVKNFEMVFGNPAKFQSWICICGKKIQITDETNCICGKSFQLKENNLVLIN